MILLARRIGVGIWIWIAPLCPRFIPLLIVSIPIWTLPWNCWITQLFFPIFAFLFCVFFIIEWPTDRYVLIVVDTCDPFTFVWLLQFNNIVNADLFWYATQISTDIWYVQSTVLISNIEYRISVIAYIAREGYGKHDANLKMHLSWIVSLTFYALYDPFFFHIPTTISLHSWRNLILLHHTHSHFFTIIIVIVIVIIIINLPSEWRNSPFVILHTIVPLICLRSTSNIQRPRNGIALLSIRSNRYFNNADNHVSSMYEDDGKMPPCWSPSSSTRQ